MTANAAVARLTGVQGEKEQVCVRMRKTESADGGGMGQGRLTKPLKPREGSDRGPNGRPEQISQCKEGCTTNNPLTALC